jgi:SAM-dependent methyltransferase
MGETMVDYSKETREIFHKQHQRIIQDRVAMERFINMFTLDYFGLGADYFKGKRVLDAGCGDTAKLLIPLWRFGARKLHGVDIGTDFIQVAQESLENFDIPLKDVKFSTGSVLDLPFEDNYFDFVSCHGVMLHPNDIDEVNIAFSELARVTKVGGYLYTVFGLVGGLFEEAIFPALRMYYRNNEDFKKLIDNIDPDNFEKVAIFMTQEAKKFTGEEIDLSFVKDLFDLDFCVFVQNGIQAPVRLAIDEKYVIGLYGKHEFNNTRRLHRYVKRKNIRKYFAPLHYHVENPISKILYGSGNLEFIGEKI